MATEAKTLRTVFFEAEAHRKKLETFSSSTSAEFQENLAAALKGYEDSWKMVQQLSLFSPNEAVDDINSGDLQFLPIDYYIAELIQKATGGDRKLNLLQAVDHYVRFLKLLDSYDILSKPEANFLEQYIEDPTAFSTASTTDPAQRRATKISRFKQEKELKTKLEVCQIMHESMILSSYDPQFLRQSSTSIEHNEDLLRQLQRDTIRLSVHKTFDALESIGQELKVLDMAPPAPPALPEPSSDPRQRTGRTDGYSERLDDLSRVAGRGGPILDAQGKPLRPFTLLDKRTQLQQGVFRPGHNLPTMTIDEYLEEERRRGGIIEGGGPQSGVREEVDEDDVDKADEETMKARAWDEFKEANPRGSGNTLNRG